MPGGIARVDRRTAQACRGSGADFSIPAGSGEAEIFYRLALGRICYSYLTERLYFVQSSHIPVSRILESVMRGLDRTLLIEQLHLDPHGVFTGARRVSIPAAEAESVLAAMRLAGIGVTLVR
jgi:hypothetical protein